MSRKQYLFSSKKIGTVLVALCTLILTLWSSFGGVNFASQTSDPRSEKNTNITQEISDSHSATGTPNIVGFPVVKVVDGDTIDVQVSAEKIERVRLIGINAPESVDPQKKVECFGNEASAKLHALLDGKNVKLISDASQQDVDKYGRLLRYVLLEDGTDVNEKMVKEGFAYEYTYKKPYERQATYRAVQKEAQTNKQGLWADGACASSK